MSLITPIKLNISNKLKNKAYFHKFFFTRTKAEIAEQIRGLREKRGFKQVELASLTNMKQSAVSRIEQSDYAGWNFKTLVRIAEALDARVQVVFTPAEDVIKEYEENERNRWTEPSTVVTGAIEQALSREKLKGPDEGAVSERKIYQRSSLASELSNNKQPKKNKIYESNRAYSRAIS